MGAMPRLRVSFLATSVRPAAAVQANSEHPSIAHLRPPSPPAVGALVHVVLVPRSNLLPPGALLRAFGLLHPAGFGKRVHVQGALGGSQRARRSSAGAHARAPRGERGWRGVWHACARARARSEQRERFQMRGQGRGWERRGDV